MKRQKGVEVKPEGLSFKPEFLTEEEERIILRELEHLPFQHFKMQGRESKREVIHFGYDYHYDARRIEPTKPIPEFLRPFHARAADWAHLSPDTLEEVLITRYPPGAGIGWHKDAPAFGSPVIGISLCSTCMMHFRRKIAESTRLKSESGEIDRDRETLFLSHEREDLDFRPAYEVYSLRLIPRSLYILHGEARSHWEHHIPQAKQLRYSITFRVLKEHQKVSRLAAWLGS